MTFANNSVKTGKCGEQFCQVETMHFDKFSTVHDDKKIPLLNCPDCATYIVLSSSPFFVILDILPFLWSTREARSGFFGAFCTCRQCEKSFFFDFVHACTTGVSPQNSEVWGVFVIAFFLLIWRPIFLMKLSLSWHAWCACSDIEKWACGKSNSQQCEKLRFWRRQQTAGG